MQTATAPDFYRELPWSLTAAGSARAMTRDFLACFGIPSDDAELIVSELVTNAVTASGETIGLRLTLYNGCLLIEVTDSSPDIPVMQPPSADMDHGRGLQMVDAFTSGDWGFVFHDTRKRVWARLPV